MAKRNKTFKGINPLEDFIKSYMAKLRHNCPTCQSTYTLLETHLTRKDLTTCQINCSKVWERIITKFCQEKVLGSELETERSQPQQNKQNHGSN